MAGMALARFTQFRGRTLFSGLVTAPLIMPEVITGISSLHALHLHGASWIGWPGKRGFTTITIAHITFSMTYVAVIVQSRLSSMDKSHRGGRDGPGLEALAGAARHHPAGHLARHRVGLAPGLHDLAR